MMQIQKQRLRQAFCEGSWLYFHNEKQGQSVLDTLSRIMVDHEDCALSPSG